MDIRMSSQHDNGYRRKLRPNKSDEIASIHLWQINVTNDCVDGETRGMKLECGNCLLTINGFKNFVPPPASTRG